MPRAMPVCYSLDEDLDLAYINPQGVVTTRDFLECIEEYAQEPAFHPEIDVLLDFRSMSEYDLGEDEVIDQLGRAIARTRDGTTDYRVACVVETDDQETLVSMSGGVLYRANEAEAFYELPEALRWLDRPGAEERVEHVRRRLEDENRSQA
jgi:hypothetical protein